jgi:hypothetical protein
MQVFTDEFLSVVDSDLAARLRKLPLSEALQLVDCCKKVQKSSSLRGSEGESLVFEYLEKNLPKIYKVVQVNSTGRSGDIVVTCVENNVRLMIDVKNYTGNVPTKEVDKFIRDIEHRNYDAAILLSLNSRVTGYKAIEFDTVRTPQRTVHFGVVVSSSQAVLLEMLELLFAMNELRLSTLGDNHEWMIERFGDLEAVAQKIGETRKTLAGAVHTLQQMFNTATEDMIHIELDACKIIAELRAGIRGTNYTHTLRDDLGELEPCTEYVINHTAEWQMSTDRKKIKCRAGGIGIQIGIMKSVSNTIEMSGVAKALAFQNVPQCSKWNYAPLTKTLTTVIEPNTMDCIVEILSLGTP